MDDRAEVRDFLTTRRARVEPHQVGLPRGDDRRVPGLRRGEVAALAGVSVEYYSRLERGAIGSASPAVLDGLARALLLDDAEHEHLRRLAARATRATPPTTERRGSRPQWQATRSLQWFLDSTTSAVAMVGNGRTDLLAWNPLGRALMADLVDTSTTPVPNFARFIFLEPVARRFYPDWEAVAATNVAQLRTEAGRVPHDKALHDLVGELATRSDHFRHLWARHDVWQHDSGTKRYHHPVVGDLTLHYDGLDLVGQDSVQLTVLTAEPGTPDHEALLLLGTWSVPANGAGTPALPLSDGLTSAGTAEAAADH